MINGNICQIKAWHVVTPALPSPNNTHIEHPQPTDTVFTTEHTEIDNDLQQPPSDTENRDTMPLPHLLP